MSKSTIVSYVPFPITEQKPGVYPGYFHIPPCEDEEKPNLLVVGDSKYHVEIDADRIVTVGVPSSEMAQSVVNDYIMSNLGYSADPELPFCMPAIFWVEGEKTLPQILKDYADVIETKKEYQSNWFQALVTIADDDWEKTRQHRAISNMQRRAAKILGLDRPWIIAPINKNGKKLYCPACRTEIHPEAAVCANCKAIIDAVKYASLQFAGVK